MTDGLYKFEETAFMTRNTTDKPPTKLKVCGILVTYNPGILVKNVILEALPQVDDLLIIDNHSEEVEFSSMKEWVINHSTVNDENMKTIVLRNDENMGLARAYNEGVRIAISNGDNVILLLDQDSVLKRNAVKNLVKNYTILSREFGDIALSAKNEEPIRLMTDGFLSKYNIRRGLVKRKNVTEVFWTINSGLFIETRLINKIGLFDETYFTDSVDHEICLRMLLHGIRIFKIEEAIIKHSLGVLKRVSFLGLDFAYRENSPVRTYYIFRDRIKTVFKYASKFPVLSFLLFASLIIQFNLILLFFEKKREHIFYIVKAAMDLLLTKQYRQINLCITR